MTALPATDRQRLAKLLGLLGSDHSGERDAAGLAAQRLLRERGLTWGDVLTPQSVEHKAPELGTWRATARQCLERSSSLRAWECGFLADLPKFRRLSTKQRYCLAEIARRVLGAAP
jgi:hypothetical protein